jgi:SAM-dependent methyltransferase
MSASRIVLAEILDDIDPDHPLARRSRRDLQRIHIVMGTLATLRRALARLRLSPRPRRILELGAGDGTLLLRLARTLAAEWSDVELTLLDRQDLIGRETREAYRDLGWQVSVVTTDVLGWARTQCTPHYDLCVTTLFLHHFREPELSEVLAAVAARSDAFVACEPRRDAWGWLGGRLVGLIGGNRITRSDAVTSVAAGFAGHELSLAWPDPDNRWALVEWRAFPFTHCFSAHALDPVPDVGCT